MSEDQKRMDPNSMESNFGRSECPICMDSRGVMFAFPCGQLICHVCRDGIKAETGPGTRGIKKPIKCYLCKDLVGRDDLKKVTFKVAPYTYEETLLRLQQDRAVISEEFELAKRLRQEKINFLQLKMSQLTELTEQTRKLRGLLRELNEL